MTAIPRQVFERLVRDHHAAVFRSAARVLRDPDRAADVVQEVFLRLVRGQVAIDAAQDQAAVLCWLATRLSHNVLRAGRRRRVHENLSAEHQAMTANDRASPAQQVLDAERRALLFAATDALPDELRLPLLLRYQDGLTFAAVGSALDLSESTAHERVTRALQRLRQRLVRGGCALGALDVEGLAAAALSTSAVPAAPAELCARLLALWAAGKGALWTAGKAAAVGLLLAGLAVAAASLQAGPAVLPPATADRAAAGLPGAGFVGAGRLLAAAADAPAGSTGRAVVPPDPAHLPPAPQDPVAAGAVAYVGTVLDAAHARVDGVVVRAVAAGSYKPFELATTTTDAAGAFTLRVPRAGREVPADRLRVRVLDGPLQLFESVELTLPAAGDLQQLPIVLGRAVGLQSERFGLQVVVTGEAGEPVVGADVALFAGGPDARVGQQPAQAQGRTDAYGHLALHGRLPGDKLLFVDGRRVGLATAVQLLEARAGGAHRCAVQLGVGTELLVRLATVDAPPPPWANLSLLDERTGVAHWTELAADGSGRFRHLGDGPFTLAVDSGDLSPMRREGVVPDGAPVQVTLKRQDDERDVGDHLAELHGRLVDAVTGEVVAYQCWDVDVRPQLPGDSTLALDRIEAPRMAQRMAEDLERDRFHLVGLAAGGHAVEVAVAGYARTVVTVELAAGELRAGFDIPLQRGATLRGRLLDAAGAPVAKASVFVVGVGGRADENLARWARDRRAGGRGSGPMPCEVRTDANGDFTVRDVPPLQRLRLVASVDGVRLAVGEATVLQPGEARGDLQLQLGPQ